MPTQTENWKASLGITGDLAVLVSTSRALVPADNGTTIEVASGVVLTLNASSNLTNGVIVIGPTTGSASISCSGVTIDGATSLAIAAYKVAAIIPRFSSTTNYLSRVS